MFYSLYSFFQKRQSLFVLLILVVCGILGFYASKIKLEEDITRFVPQDKNSKAINSILDNLKSKDKLVIHFTASNPTLIDSLIQKSDVFYNNLISRLKRSDYHDIIYKISDDRMGQIYELFCQNLPFFLEEQDYSQISNLILKDSINETLKKNYHVLLYPSGMVLSKYITRDPLTLTPIALKKLQAIQLDENFETYDNHIVTKDHLHTFIFITPKNLPNQTKANQHLIQIVDSLSSQLKTPSLVIENFGACVVASDNAQQLQKDTTFTLSIAIILIALLLGLYFRNLLVTLFIMLPVGFGVLFSLAFLFLFKGVVSAIAIAAGAIVLGIAINYSLHFFTHYKHHKNVGTVLKDLTLPMLIGCTTTVGAFLSLLFAKSEALHDFGLFAAFSLIGAMLFSIIVLPHLLAFGLRKKKKNLKEEELSSSSFIDKITELIVLFEPICYVIN